MRAQDLIAELTQNAADAIIRNFKAMPEDRRNWQPTPGARSALNQLWEIGIVNEQFAQFLTGTATEPLSFEKLGKLWASECPDSAEVLIEKVTSATARLCDAIRELPDEKLEELIEMNPGAKIPGKMVMYLGLRNTWYHLGQVNYIQSLYGDGEMH